MRICLEVWGSDPRRLVEVAMHAEMVGLDGVYLGEGPTGLNADAWSTLGAIAAQTHRIRLGPVIANLLPDARSPVAMARHGATLAALSQGRFDFRTGIGAAGGSGRRWWEPAGIRYPGYAQRAIDTDRQLAILRRLWSGEAVDLGDGPFELGLCHPPIEITVAATSATAFEIARIHADRWETSFATPMQFQQRAHVAPPGLATSLEIDGFVGSIHEPERVWRQVVRDRGTEDLDAIRRRALVGSPLEVRDRLDDFDVAGVDQLVVALHDPTDLDAISALAESRRP
ncbi:MAG: LLM class flavin-dependent oxidoreductase [Actinomycetota bacterium]